MTPTHKQPWLLWKEQRSIPGAGFLKHPAGYPLGAQGAWGGGGAKALVSVTLPPPRPSAQPGP